MKIELMAVSALLATAVFGGPLAAAEPGIGVWAAADDPVAAKLIELERQWATHACVPNDVLQTLLAEDFVGTSPGGDIYTKAEGWAKPGAAHSAPRARDCKLLSAKVRYYGPDVAVIYGKESAIETGADGKDKPRTVVWTDTLLRRGGRWQIIAVQDMVMPEKQTDTTDK
ncbi:nuclear transport factor 2 family protein [Sandarakinorhabdus sp.]|uniref:nuclear transport factor 2 family protein n=1 Tax=Sandarakinorhabdus sp. TaxID=1916663 RepID=UPI00286E373D|nr:nuclear transport factor 2 family protein [Sandarakinorhabdus sp.]